MLHLRVSGFENHLACPQTRYRLDPVCKPHAMKPLRRLELSAGRSRWRSHARHSPAPGRPTASGASRILRLINALIAFALREIHASLPNGRILYYVFPFIHLIQKSETSQDGNDTV